MSAAQLNINLFDAAILGILTISALIAFFRGFIRELLSLGAWVGAAIITVYLFPHSTDMMKHHVKSEGLAAGIAALGTYIAALISISLLNAIIIRYVRPGTEVGLLDNFLGLIFGSLRGMFIVSLAFLIISTMVPKDPEPKWLETSITKPYLQKGADILTKVAPKYLNELEELVKKNSNEKDKTDDASENGYKPDDQKNMNRLIDSTQSQGANPNRGQ